MKKSILKFVAGVTFAALVAVNVSVGSSSSNDVSSTIFSLKQSVAGCMEYGDTGWGVCCGGDGSGCNEMGEQTGGPYYFFG